MKINDTWEKKDVVSGLRLKVIPGINQDCLHVESLTGGTANDVFPKMNRDFWFTKDGKFDGTGSGVESNPNRTVSVAGAMGYRPLRTAHAVVLKMEKKGRYDRERIG